MSTLQAQCDHNTNAFKTTNEYINNVEDYLTRQELMFTDFRS